MKLSRRNFIKAGTVAAAAITGTNLVAPVFSSAQEKSAALSKIPAGVFAEPLFKLTAEDFKQCLGTEFLFITDQQTYSAVLSNISMAKKPAKSTRSSRQLPIVRTRGENFTLSFQMAENDFPQATYQLWHPNLGELSLFLVPGVSEKGVTTLDAVINRI